MSLYDATGRLVTVLVDRASESGRVSVEVSELASGTYVIRLETATGVARTAKLVVAK